MKRTRCLTIAMVLCAAAMAVSAPLALGQNPSVDGYDETGASTIPPIDVTPPPSAALGQVESSSPRSAAIPQGPSSSPAAAGPESAESKALAFTGFGLPLLALLGGTLLAAGALTRWRLRSQVS